MAIILIMLFTILFMWGAFVISYGGGGVQNGKYLLGITLPSEYRKEKEVLEILSSYRKAVHRTWGFGLISGLSLLLLSDYFSILFPCLMLWFGLFLYFCDENVLRYARRLYGLKCKKGWLVGDTHIVRIDTALSCVGKKGALSPLWMLPAWGITLGAVVWCFPRAGESAAMKTLLPAALAPAVTQLLLFLISLGLRNAAPQVFCSSSSANQKLNNVIKRQWSMAFTFCSYETAVLFCLLLWSVKGWEISDEFTGFGDLTYGRLSFLFLALVLGTTGTLLAILLAFHKIKTEKEKILQSVEAEGAQLYSDGDEYWLNGVPGGTGGLKVTEKRIGVGLTLSSPGGGGTLGKAVIVLTAAFTIGISLFLAPFDFARVSLTVEDGRCRVGAASMGYSFEMKDVRGITWMEERPKMSKISGFDSNRFYLGDFRVKDYGKCKAYLSVKQDAVICIETQEKTIWVNGESLEQTKEFYEMLMREWEGENEDLS